MEDKMKNKKIITEKFEKMLKACRLTKKNASVMLATTYFTYYENRKGKTKRKTLSKYMLLYLLCEFFVKKKDFKTITDIMKDTESWEDKGIEFLDKNK